MNQKLDFGEGGIRKKSMKSSEHNSTHPKTHQPESDRNKSLPPPSEKANVMYSNEEVRVRMKSPIAFDHI